jgi:hypothetical protein
MTAPLRMSFNVDCSAEHAFAVWTSGIGTWWPVIGSYRTSYDPQ